MLVREFDAPPGNLGFNITGKPPTVSKISSSSSLQGLVKVGYQLLSVNGKNTQRMSAWEALALIRDEASVATESKQNVRFAFAKSAEHRPDSVARAAQQTISFTVNFNDENTGGYLGFNISGMPPVVSRVDPTLQVVRDKKLQVGYKLLAVNGTRTDGMNAASAVQLIRNEAKTGFLTGHGIHFEFLKPIAAGMARASSQVATDAGAGAPSSPSSSSSRHQGSPARPPRHRRSKSAGATGDLSVAADEALRSLSRESSSPNKAKAAEGAVPAAAAPEVLLKDHCG